MKTFLIFILALYIVRSLLKVGFLISATYPRTMRYSKVDDLVMALEYLAMAIWIGVLLSNLK
jgi:hypothetical protein